MPEPEPAATDTTEARPTTSTMIAGRGRHDDLAHGLPPLGRADAVSGSAQRGIGDAGPRPAEGRAGADARAGPDAVHSPPSSAAPAQGLVESPGEEIGMLVHPEFPASGAGQGRDDRAEHHAGRSAVGERHPPPRPAGLRRQPGDHHHRPGRRVRPRPSFTEVAARAERLAKALGRPRGGRQRPGGHLPVEQPDPPRGLPGHPRHGGGPPHLEPPPVPRAAGLRDQPRRGQGDHRRRLAGPAAGPGPGPAHDRQAHRRGRARATPVPSGRPSSYEELLAAEEPGYDVARLRRTPGRGHVLHVGHHRQPEGRRLQPPLDVPALDGRHLGVIARHQRARPGALHRPHVPRQRLGHALRGLHGRRRPGHAPAVPAGRAAGRHHRPTPPDPVGRCAHHLERPAALRPDPRGRPLVAADDHRRRRGRAPAAHRAVPGRARASRWSRDGG